MEIKKIELSKVIVDEEQPRKDFINIGELASSIVKEGLIQPIEVSPLNNGTYKIIDGERRFRACSLLKHKEINCIIYDGKSDVFIRQLVTDFQKEKLGLLEQAEAIKKLTDEGMTLDNIRISLGLQRSKLYMLKKILTFNDRTKGFISEGKLTQNIIVNISKEDINSNNEDELINEIIEKRAKSKGEIDKIVFSITDFRYSVNVFLSHQYAFERRLDDFNSFLEKRRGLIDTTIKETIKCNDDSLRGKILTARDKINNILQKLDIKKIKKSGAD